MAAILLFSNSLPIQTPHWPGRLPHTTPISSANPTHRAERGTPGWRMTDAEPPAPPRPPASPPRLPAAMDILVLHRRLLGRLRVPGNPKQAAELQALSACTAAYRVAAVTGAWLRPAHTRVPNPGTSSLQGRHLRREWRGGGQDREGSDPMGSEGDLPAPPLLRQPNMHGSGLQPRQVTLAKVLPAEQRRRFHGWETERHPSLLGACDAPLVQRAITRHLKMKGSQRRRLPSFGFRSGKPWFRG